MHNNIGGNSPQNNGISYSAAGQYQNPQTGYKDIFYQLEQSIGADVQKVQQLVQQGIITKQQGSYFMAQLARKAQEINNYKSSLAGHNSVPVNTASTAGISDSQYQTVSETPLAIFEKERPGFFQCEGRKDILNYIKGYDMDKDEILQISKLVENLENSAINNYLKKSEYEKSLNDENAAAKSRLTAYAQNAGFDSNINRIFTREDIGRMSGDEFTKNEKLIMDQVKQGLIK